MKPDGVEPPTPQDEVFSAAFRQGVSSGVAAAGAMFVQIAFLMPIDTTVTYQYRFGVSMEAAGRALYGGGGIARFYAGVIPALAQGPLARFGDTASNAAVISFLEAHPETRDLPIVAQTLMGSVAAASWRVVLMPLDVCKTLTQVRGSVEGWREISSRLKGDAGVATLWRGSSASFVSTLCGHLPWYSTFNFLNKTVPQFGSSSSSPEGVRRVEQQGGDREIRLNVVAPESRNRSSSSSSSSGGGGGNSICDSGSAEQQKEEALSSSPPAVAGGTEPWQRAVRHGLIGFTASVVSDCCTNSLRVVKAIRQAEGVTYSKAVHMVVAQDGVVGLFGRGLKTRILANGFQGLLFTALWKSLEEAIEHKWFGMEPRR